MAKGLQQIGPRFQVSPLVEPSQYVQPQSAHYDWNGKLRRWDIVVSHASVGIVLYHTGLDALLIVRQFRPAVYASAARVAAAAGLSEPPFSVGYTYELCAGIVDKPVSLQQICKEEIAEECGFNVDVASLVHIAPSISSSGTGGVVHEMYYAEVDESMRIPSGGGGEVAAGEFIELLALPLEQATAFVLDGALPKSPGLMFGLLWAFHEIKGKRAVKGNGSSMETGTLELGSVLTA